MGASIQIGEIHSSDMESLSPIYDKLLDGLKLRVYYGSNKYSCSFSDSISNIVSTWSKDIFFYFIFTNSSFYIELRNQYNFESQITYMLLSMHQISVYSFDRVKFTVLFNVYISFLIVLLLRIHYNFQSE